MGSVIDLNTSQVQGPIGFTESRSADGDTTVSASQDILTPTPFLVKGIGQTAGDLASQVTFPNAVVGAVPPPDGAFDAGATFFGVLLATGTWEFDGTNKSIVSWDLSGSFQATVFQVGSDNTENATLIGLTFPPEPASLSMLAIGGLLTLLRRHRTA